MMHTTDSFREIGPPITSFKYRSGAAALRCLKDGHVYFAASAELNDMLEARFDFIDASESWEILKSVMDELAIARNSTWRPEHKKPIPDEVRLSNEASDLKFYAACQTVGIYSTSTRPDSQPMWAYYCDDYRGVCLELEWTEEVIAEANLQIAHVTYTDKSRRHSQAEDLSYLLRELAANNPCMSLDQLLQLSLDERFRRRLGKRGIARATSIKHSDWQHEAEMRLLAPKWGPRPLLKAVLRKVYFVRTDFPEWGPILGQLYQQYPGVEVIELSFHHAEPFVRRREYEYKLVPLPS